MVAPGNEFIPQEVTDDIFARLPIKSLIRFKSVSKPFRASLSDPAFARWHYHRSKSYRDDTKFLLLSKVKNQGFVIASCPKHDPNNPALSMTISDFDFPKKKSTERVIIGSGDGLFCTYTVKKGIEVWNPSTRELRLLPELGRPSFGGICYDPNIDDYNVIVFFDHKYAVFELKGKLWRISGRYRGCYTVVKGWDYYNSSPRRLQPTATEPVNGSIHWMAIGARGRRDFTIYSFDLRKEELSELAPPPDCDPQNSELGVLYGCLSMVKYYDKIWMMKEYGVWTELYFYEEGSMLVLERVGKLYRFADGFLCGHSLHICNLGYGKPICVDREDENYGKSTCGVPAVCWITKMIQYSESLISPRVTR